MTPLMQKEYAESVLREQLHKEEKARLDAELARFQLEFAKRAGGDVSLTKASGN